MGDRFDAIVVGSGFGGSVIACRLAQKGLKVLVLERGRRWTPADYPRKPTDAWFFNASRPEAQHGWLDLRLFARMIVAQGAGVGGGSLCYSSVALEAPASCFERGWPAAITHDALRPHYDAVARMLRLQPIPDGQLTARLELTRDAAARLGHAPRFAKAPLAVSFSRDWHYGLEEPFDRRHSKTFVNDQGVTQGTCIHLGNCDIGCDVGAKNGLDVTYLPLAERHGCEIRPLHLVRSLRPDAAGYRVTYDRITPGGLVSGEVFGARVFLAAGSLGTTELLLRARDEHRTLTRLSPRLGERWSANANVLSLADYGDRGRVRQSVGPTISATVDFMDGATGERFVVADDGFPDVLLQAFGAMRREAGDHDVHETFGDEVIEALSSRGKPRGLMLWLGAGVDAGDGTLRLARRWYPPFRRELDLRWRSEGARGVVSAIRDMHAAMSHATGGRLRPDLAWRLFGTLLTLHPLGGCAMAEDARTGVVDHTGQVFGHPGLHVVDGSIVPVPIGRNPSHTIAALAERIAAEII
jgi:cholesterol oxidase